MSRGVQSHRATEENHDNLLKTLLFGLISYQMNIISNGKIQKREPRIY
jgi:hypothetical protein